MLGPKTPLQPKSCAIEVKVCDQSITCAIQHEHDRPNCTCAIGSRFVGQWYDSLTLRPMYLVCV
ncbi:hypothetical protein HanXRQr2_Chr16g0752011 [Helianthus annuus]|uniref:Uncharacterized protein n=1 Tax=Helianthus annuus TaxID=4232 RepID=A0A9K3DRH4_HELAN|nr:hypothetical protein HanXRQr2_Chr16g0752011 [Helianthus annuus]